MAATDYLRGTGTEADPYIIHSAAAWAAFMSNTAPCFQTVNTYFEVVSDINCGGLSIGEQSGKIFKATLKGNGHVVNNFKFTGNYHWSHAEGGYSGAISDIHLDATWSAYGSVSTNTGSWLKCSNVKFTIRGGLLYGYSDTLCGKNNGANLSNVIIELISGGIFGRNDTSSYKFPASVYLLSASALPAKYLNATHLIGSQQYLPANYPTLDIVKWQLDGVSSPKPIPNGRTDLTQKYAVKGNTKVGGIGKSRTVLVYVAAHGLLLKQSKSVTSGDYLVDLGDVYDPVIVTHYDSYGYPHVTEKNYTLGDRIHPPTPNGYCYVCTTAGTSGSQQPSSWPTTGTLTTGSAIFTPIPIYKPESQLVQPVKIDLLTGLPV